MRKLISLCCVVTVLLLASCSATESANAENQDAAQTLQPLTMAMMPSLDGLPIFIADEMGFFKEQGLEVKLERFSAARDRDIAFQTSEDIDGLIFDLIALSIYAEAGVDMLAVASTLGHASLIGAEGIESLGDLNESTVLISRSTAMEYILNRALMAAGLTPNDVIIEEVPSLPTRLEMLRNGNAHAATLPEPFATIAKDAGLNVVTTTRDLGINPFILAFRRQTVEDKAQELQAFFKGIDAAVDYLNTTDREEFIDILIDVVGYPADTRDTLSIPEFQYLRPVDMNNALDALSFSRDIGLLTREISAEDVIIDIFVRP